MSAQVSNTIKFYEQLSFFKCTKFVKTKDDFLPNFERNEVAVNIFVNMSSPAVVVVSVHGYDDFGLEKIFEIADLSQARDLFNSIKNGIRINTLKSMGFKNA